jgi:hypothetical protein
MKEWRLVKRHVPAEITLLCDSHHRQAGAGMIPKRAVLHADANPRNIETAKSQPLPLWFSGNEIDIRLGGCTFHAQGSPLSFYPIVVDSTPLIAVRQEENRLLFDLTLKSQIDEKPYVQIVENELVYRTIAYDIEFVKNRLSFSGGDAVDIVFVPEKNLLAINGTFFHEGITVVAQANLLSVPGTFTFVNQRFEHMGVSVGHSQNPKLGKSMHFDMPKSSPLRYWWKHPNIPAPSGIFVENLNFRSHP